MTRDTVLTIALTGLVACAGEAVSFIAMIVLAIFRLWPYAFAALILCLFMKYISDGLDRVIKQLSKELNGD